MNMKYNIIGDIHARTCWRHLVKEEYINIFVGDYFDPYEYIPQVERVANFQALMDYKWEYPNNTILLYGNHDLHYLIADEQYARYEPRYANEYWRMFMQTESLFYGVAFPIGNKALVTHAGVSKEWYESYFGKYKSESLAEVADKINQLWQENKQAFAFEPNATTWGDRYGISPTHSPLWIRPDTLVKHDLFAGKEVKQIIGHTQTEAGVMKDHNIICVDCLGTKEKSFIWES